MTAKRIWQICMLITSVCSLVVVGGAQDQTQRRIEAAPDPGNASIVGRVSFPSGSSADFNIKVTLSNSQSNLNTLYSDKNGEFRFLNLNAGVYYVLASAESSFYQPVKEEVRIYRGQELNLTIILRKSAGHVSKRSGPGIVSAVELDQNVPATAKKEYKEAARLIYKGQLQEAIERLCQAIAICPDYLTARNDLGAQYLKLRRFREATEQFEAAIRINPKYFNSRLNLGMVLVEEKRYTEAIGHLKVALSINDGWPAAHLFAGIALMEINELDAAQREIVKAMILGAPRYSVGHYYLAHAYMRRGDRGEAVRELETYLGEQPDGELATAARTLLAKLK
jgi:tetratricopeptide (TPR) repeat protein